ncbi:MAG: serine hydrolase domain-containing protein [Pirellulaceae bacterium]
MPHLPLAKPEEIGLDPQRLQRAYDLLEKWTAGPDAPIPGGTIAVGRRGKFVEPKYFGRQGPEADAPPIRRDGMFLLASITKPIVYLGAMMLVERGLLSLSRHVTDYLPEFAAHHKETTLVQQLFTHTSGLPDMLKDNEDLRRAHAPLEKFIAGAIRETVPLFAPGTGYSYQSMGTLIVAELVQKLSGLTIHEFLRKEIFEPLGLASSSLGSRGLADKTIDRIVRVQTQTYQEPSFNWNSKYWRELGSPWGGMFSTPEDFAVLCQLMLSGGKHGNVRLVSPRTVELMTSNRLDDHPSVPESIRRSRPWGLGWSLNHRQHDDVLSDVLGPHIYGHIGSTGTLFWVDPKSDGFCIIFTSGERARGPWRLVALSNAVAAAFE